MRFPRYKAKNQELKINLAFEFAKPLLAKVIDESMKNKLSDEEMSQCKDLIIETSFKFADRFIRKALD